MSISVTLRVLDATIPPLPVSGEKDARMVSSATLQHLLLVLSTYSDHDGTGAWPSIERLARQLGCTRRTVQRALSALVVGGYIEPDGVSIYGTHRWTILLDKLRGCPPVTKGMTPGHKGDDPGTHKTSFTRQRTTRAQAQAHSEEPFDIRKLLGWERQP